MRFQWDENKNESNIVKHGVSFDEASTVFDDEEAIFISDPDHSVGEERFLLLGLSSREKILVVCHCYREMMKLSGLYQPDLPQKTRNGSTTRG